MIKLKANTIIKTIIKKEHVYKNKNRNKRSKYKIKKE